MVGSERYASWTAHDEPGVCVLVLCGELDLTTAEEFADAAVHLAATIDPGTRLVVDLADVTFMDSTGLRALLRIHAHAKHALVLRSPRRPVRRVLNLTVPEMFAIE